jgi:Holliday junction resolvase RusA-like endonuclease
MIHVFQFDQVISKPRMTRSDKWKERPCVMAYRAFADAIRLAAGPEVLSLRPSELHIIVHIKMPKSWSKTKQADMLGQMHRGKPDWDNIGKAFSDALYPDDDSFIAHGSVVKYWGYEDLAHVTIVDNEQPKK